MNMLRNYFLLTKILLSHILAKKIINKKIPTKRIYFIQYNNLFRIQIFAHTWYSIYISTISPSTHHVLRKRHALYHKISWHVILKAVCLTSLSTCQNVRLNAKLIEVG